ncbi:hypothetical protein BH688_06410 [Kushneria phosphatilytica]|nr:hypothetical protein [Kushneria phosphatilytica]OHV12263.1 hypothetical protein BH688_06410 [Kushneria phosphatilytica]
MRYIAEIQTQTFKKVIKIEQADYPSQIGIDGSDPSVAQVDIELSGDRRNGELPGGTGPGEFGVGLPLLGVNGIR